MKAHAAVILLGDVGGGTAGVAVILKGDAPCDHMGSPPHRAEEGPVLIAAGALQGCRSMNAHLAVILLHRVEEGPVLSVAARSER
jgi:hypothetical protein